MTQNMQINITYRISSAISQKTCKLVLIMLFLKILSVNYFTQFSLIKSNSLNMPLERIYFLGIKVDSLTDMNRKLKQPKYKSYNKSYNKKL